ncbi:hypothetical protein B0H14DRAFT_2570671 [Mycena olivaceomarginata]|nr:hypothetical protein B0H14DRAFT_2570671 [Mycena olivaceomarginata]
MEAPMKKFQDVDGPGRDDSNIDMKDEEDDDEMPGLVPEDDMDGYNHRWSGLFPIYMSFDSVYYCYGRRRLSIYPVTSVTEDLQKGEHLIFNAHQVSSYPRGEGVERASSPREVVPDILQAWGDNRTCMGGASTDSPATSLANNTILDIGWAVRHSRMLHKKVLSKNISIISKKNPVANKV